MAVGMDGSARQRRWALEMTYSKCKGRKNNKIDTYAKALTSQDARTRA